MQPKLLIVLAITLYGFYYGYQHRELKQAPGVLVKEAPKQIDIPQGKQRSILIKNGVIDPLADYFIKARVLSTERYWVDPGSKVAPIDLVLGWGPMSDSKVIDALNIQQRGRFYFYAWQGGPPIDVKQIAVNSANVHIIPGDPLVEKQVLSLRTGQIVEMKGQLVRVNYKDGGDWVSSLSRDDVGNGACELMYVTAMTVRNY